MITENQLSAGDFPALKMPELRSVANLWRNRNRREPIHLGRRHEQYRKVKPKFAGTPVMGIISVLLFCLTTPFFFFLCVMLMDALNVINIIQEAVTILVGTSMGLIGFFIFKRSFLKIS